MDTIQMLMVNNKEQTIQYVNQAFANFYQSNIQYNEIVTVQLPPKKSIELEGSQQLDVTLPSANNSAGKQLPKQDNIIQRITKATKELDDQILEFQNIVQAQNYYAAALLIQKGVITLFKSSASIDGQLLINADTNIEAALFFIHEAKVENFWDFFVGLQKNLLLEQLPYEKEQATKQREEKIKALLDILGPACENQGIFVDGKKDELMLQLWKYLQIDDESAQSDMLAHIFAALTVACQFIIGKYSDSKSIQLCVKYSKGSKSQQRCFTFFKGQKILFKINKGGIFKNNCPPFKGRLYEIIQAPINFGEGKWKFQCRNSELDIVIEPYCDQIISDCFEGCF